jgi:hypothetical protein
MAKGKQKPELSEMGKKGAERTNYLKGKEREKMKKKFLAVLRNSLGVVSTACESLNISRQTYYVWRAEDKEFLAEVEAIAERAIDFAESHLFKNIKAGKEASTIFYLKTKGKHRGYIERQQVEFNQIEEVYVTIDETTTAIQLPKDDAKGQI